MDQFFKFQVPEEDAGLLMIALNEIPGIDAKIQVYALPKPDSAKEHGVYAENFQDLTILIISITAVVTSFANLATAIFNYSQAKEKKKENKNDLQYQHPTIIVNETTIVIETFKTKDELTKYLEDKLRRN